MSRLRSLRQASEFSRISFGHVLRQKVISLRFRPNPRFPLALSKYGDVSHPGRVLHSPELVAFSVHYHYLVSRHSTAGGSTAAITGRLSILPDGESDDKTRSNTHLGANSIIGHYRIIEKIGVGGMGEVYLAEDAELDRKVALKFLPQHLCQDADCRARFKREAQAAARLSHPNVITIYEVSEFHGRPFIAMELVVGKSLREIMKQEHLTLERAIDVATQVCEGLQEAHEAGIVHRDIKPSNVMVDRKSLCKLLDFGLAAIRGSEPLTRSGSTLGTVGYMSPEQVRGATTDARSDIFSVGVVMYEMISGVLPFRGEYEAAILYAIAHEEPEPLAKKIPDLPPLLENAVEKALKKDVDARYQTVAELLEDLRKLRTQSEFDSSPQVGVSARSHPSIAVLPFANLSADREQDYFCDGMAEEIINALSQVAGLQVVARTSAFAFRSQEVDICEIGRRLRVRTVLEGSVRKIGNHLRITSQLIDVGSGYHLWSERFDREMEDVFAVQDEIALAIVKNLEVKLLAGEKHKLVKRYTDDPVAYGLYLKGRYFWNRRYEWGLTKGIEYFQQAIQKDALYAPAYVGVADCYNQFGYYGMMPPRQAYEKARSAVMRALEIDETVAEAHACVGWIKTFFDWDWEGAEREFRRALQLNPNSALAHNWYGLFLGIRGRYEECIAEGRRSLELEPVSLVYNTVWSLGFYWTREYDKAIVQLKKTIEMDPTFPLTYLFMGFACTSAGLWDEATDALTQFQSTAPDSPLAIGHLGLVCGLSDRRQEALQMLERLQESSQHRYVSPFYPGLIYMGLNDLDKAFVAFHEAAVERDSWMATLKTAPFLDRLRGDARYQALLKEIGL